MSKLSARHNSPLISVVMSVYNEEEYVASAIDCILDQDFENFEFIIIDDGSDDKTASIIRSYKDDRIILVSRENRGLTPSLNEGMRLAKGRYIARQDADDVSYCSRFSKQFDYLENHKKTVLLGTRAIINSEYESLQSPVIGKDQIKVLLRRTNIFVHSSVMLRASTFRNLDFYDEKYETSQDYDAWLRMSQHGEMAIMDEILMERNLRRDSISSKKHFIQCLNGYKIRKKHLSRYTNIGITLYHYFSGILPVYIMLLIRKLKNILGRK